MWQPQLKAASDYTQGWVKDDTAVGLSFFIDDDIEGRRYIGYYGEQNGFRSYLSLCPSARTASILISNTETRPTVNGQQNLLSPETKIASGVFKFMRSLRAR